MPLAFPSHQGLILPLWQRYPRAIDGVALCVGAAMPDVVDALVWPLRGELGQGFGHSLIGLLACTPLGLVLALVARRVLPRTWIARFDRGRTEDLAVGPAMRLGRAALAAALGAASHLASDLFTHANLVLFWPHDIEHAFPGWWERAWFHVPLLVYREPYPVAPHTLVWLVFSALGVWLFVRAWRRGPRAV